MGHLQKIKYSFALLLLMACNSPSAPDCFQMGGKEGVLSKDLDSFNTLHLTDHLHYVLHSDSNYHCEIEGPENLLPEIDFQYNEGTLLIQNKNSCNLIRSYRRNITVHLYAPAFPSIINESTLLIESPDTLRQAYLHWQQFQASSNASLVLHCDSAHFEIPTGYGDLLLSGISKKLKLYTSAIGIIDARHLRSEELYCNQSSIQDLFVNSTGYAYINISNKGNVYYMGTPNQTDLINTGSGQWLPMP
jgi:hypothetical protein